MSEQTSIVDPGSLPWSETAYRGVGWKILHHDPVSGRSVFLLRFEPGASYPMHRHPEWLFYDAIRVVLLAAVLAGVIVAFIPFLRWIRQLTG